MSVNTQKLSADPNMRDIHADETPVYREVPISLKNAAYLINTRKLDPNNPEHAHFFEPVKILVGFKKKVGAKVIELVKTPQQQSDEIMAREEQRINESLAELNIQGAPYPVFPRWVFESTSIYKGLVKPICDANSSRIPEFLFMPAVVFYLNYLGTKVRIAAKDYSLALFLIMIGRRGQTKKSSSALNAVQYFQAMGCVGYGQQSTDNANSRALIFTPGSPEGMGKEMCRLNCKNGIIFFDELSTLTKKAGIDGSNLTSALTLIYESATWANSVKSPKDSFSLLAGTYCASLIACSTDKNFEVNWSKLAAASSGLDDRCYFLIQPEELPTPEPYTHVATEEASIVTKQLIEKARTQGIYKIEDPKRLLNEFMKNNKSQDRMEIRVEKFALYFAIDLGRETIDEDCIRRALALIEYEKAVKKFLPRFEAYNKQAILQQRMQHEVNRHGGTVAVRTFEDNLNMERYGTDEWERAYKGLIRTRWMIEGGKGVKGDPLRLIQQKPMPSQDED